MICDSAGACQKESRMEGTCGGGWTNSGWKELLKVSSNISKRKRLKGCWSVFVVAVIGEDDDDD